jgi:hypothetical protein
MKFEEKRVGDYCVYTGAVEALSGDGFMAAVVVHRDMPGNRSPQEVFRDERMSGGHRWPTDREALNFAMQRGLDAIRQHSHPAPEPTPTILPLHPMQPQMPNAARSAAGAAGHLRSDAEHVRL